MALNPKQQRFVEEFIVDLNATQAAKRAGYAPKAAYRQGADLLRHPQVRAAIDEANAKRSASTGVTADAVLARLWAIASADARELVEYRRTCCRQCWPDVAYDGRRDPNKDCQNCEGLGHAFPVVHDTRKLSDSAARLYAGVRKTKDGIEVKMHDPLRALEMIGRHLGMWKDGASIPLPVNGGDLHVHFEPAPAEASS